MENVLFIYNIILTVMFSVSLAGSYMLYMKNGKREFVFASSLFFLLIVENSIVYMSEFSTNFKDLYETSEILYIVIYAVFFAIVVALRLIISEYFGDGFTKHEKQSTAMVASVLVVANITMPFQIGEMIVYSSFYGGLIYMAWRFYKNLNKDERQYSGRIMKNCRAILICLVLLCVSGIVESGLYFMSYSKEAYISQDVLSLEYRNIAFDVIKLIICIAGALRIKYSFESLFDKSDSGKINMDEKMREFCIDYSLTNRQKEIIELIVEGCSNKEISARLHITEGTVKTHVYNIFKKVGISSRNQLMKKIMHD